MNYKMNDKIYSEITTLSNEVKNIPQILISVIIHTVNIEAKVAIVLQTLLKYYETFYIIIIKTNK